MCGRCPLGTGPRVGPLAHGPYPVSWSPVDTPTGRGTPTPLARININLWNLKDGPEPKTRASRTRTPRPAPPPVSSDDESQTYALSPGWTDPTRRSTRSRHVPSRTRHASVGDGKRTLGGEGGFARNTVGVGAARLFRCFRPGTHGPAPPVRVPRVSPEGGPVDGGREEKKEVHGPPRDPNSSEPAHGTGVLRPPHVHRSL